MAQSETRDILDHCELTVIANWRIGQTAEVMKKSCGFSQSEKKAKYVCEMKQNLWMQFISTQKWVLSAILFEQGCWKVKLSLDEI